MVHIPINQNSQTHGPGNPARTETEERHLALQTKLLKLQKALHTQVLIGMHISRAELSLSPSYSLSPLYNKSCLSFFSLFLSPPLSLSPAI